MQIAGIFFNYADDFARMDTSQLMHQGSVRDAPYPLADSLESDPDSVENAAYEAAKSAGAKPRDVFVCMYTRLQSQLVQNLAMYSYVCIRYC